MLRVSEVLFVEREPRGWAVAFEPDGAHPGALRVGQVLVSGMRRWTVAEVHDAPRGLVAGRLAGDHPLTRGLLVRPVEERMGDAEFKAGARLLVRLARAFRSVDLDGMIARVSELPDRTSPANAAVARAALLGKHLVESGPTDADLTAAARAFNIDDER